VNVRNALKVVLVSALVVVPIGAAGCGDEADNAVDQVTSAVDEGIDSATSSADDAIDSATTDDTSTADAQVLEIPAAAEGLAYQTTAVSATAGTITLRMPNPSAIPHNIAIEEPETETGDVVNQNGVSEVTADFEAGTYTYFCTVPGHRDAGMEGTLTVN
jgi:plastocyanin